MGSVTGVGIAETAVGRGLGIGCDAGVGTTGLPDPKTEAVEAGCTTVGCTASVKGIDGWAVVDPWPLPVKADSLAGICVASGWQPARRPR